MIPNKALLHQTFEIVSKHVHQTPVLTSRLANQLVGAEVFFKCENFQKMGAFKMRGAVSAIQSLDAHQQQGGVVTHSSGNFGQAVALAAQQLGVKAYIVMPHNAPNVKINAVKAYDGEVVLCEPSIAAREKASQELVASKGATFLHPSNQIEVILGNATAAMELLQEQPNLDCIFAPVGGGGLLAGTALAAHYFGQNCKVLGGEPLAANDAYRSLQSGKIEGNSTTNTIADGLRTTLGDVNFPIIQKLVDEIICVTEDEIVQAMQFIWERLKIIIEPSCAVPFAGLVQQKAKFKHKKIGIILSGGNVDVTKLPF